MATLVYSLSSKSNVIPGRKEVMVRFFHGRFNQRGRTKIFVDESLWDDKRQCNKIPKVRVISEDKRAMIQEAEHQNSILSSLSSFLKTSFVNENSDAFPKTWLTDKITEFHSAQDPDEELKDDSTLNVFERYIDVHNMADSQKRQYRVIYRALKRFSLYSKISIEFEDFTADTLREFEDFLLKEHTFIATDKSGKPYIKNAAYKAVYASVPECRYPKQRGKAGWLVPVLIVSKLNASCVEETLRFYCTEFGITMAMVNRFNIGGLGLHHAPELNLSRDELREVFARIDKVAGELGMTIQSGVCTPMCVLNPGDYPNIRFSHCSTDLSNRPLTVNYKGEVRFCNHSPRVLGNIYDKNIGEIVSECQNDGYFDKVPEYCTTCNLWSLCRGGCRAASEQLFGTFDKADPILFSHHHHRK